MRPSAAARLKPRLLSLLHEVPRGRVTTYGTLAACLGVSARLVARVMASLSEAEAEGAPWHRVVGAGGVLRTAGGRQAERLRREGVGVSARDRVEGFARLLFTPSAEG